MAEFCLQCAEKFGFPNDFEGLTSPEDWAKGRAAIVLCEECGPIQVDPDGRCIVDCRLHHGIVMALAVFLTEHLISRNFVQLTPKGLHEYSSLTMEDEIKKGLELYEQAHKKGDAH